MVRPLPATGAALSDRRGARRERAASLRQAAADAVQLQYTLTDPHGQAADWTGFQAAYVFVRQGHNGPKNRREVREQAEDQRYLQALGEIPQVVRLSAMPPISSQPTMPPLRHTSPLR
jgi:hypothetical protein